MTLRRAIEPEGAPQTPEEAAAALADQFLFSPPRPPKSPPLGPRLWGLPVVVVDPADMVPPADGWGRALFHERKGAEAWARMFPVEHSPTVTP